MGKVQLNVYDDEAYPVFYANKDAAGKYSLTKEEYAEYEFVCEEYERWQTKLYELKPDDYVAPPPITEEELQRREANYAKFEFQHSEAYLDLIAPIPGAV